MALHPVLKTKSLFKKARAGQSLVEAIVAVGIAILVITGLVVLAVGAGRTATLSRNRSLAVQYGQEGVEALRSIRDRDYTELPTDGGPYRVVWTGTQWDTLAGTEQIEMFTRSFAVSEPTAGKLQFDLAVTWTDSAGDHDVTLSTYLADWR